MCNLQKYIFKYFSIPLIRLAYKLRIFTFKKVLHIRLNLSYKLKLQIRYLDLFFYEIIKLKTDINRQVYQWPAFFLSIQGYVAPQKINWLIYLDILYGSTGSTPEF